MKLLLLNASLAQKRTCIQTTRLAIITIRHPICFPQIHQTEPCSMWWLQMFWTCLKPGGSKRPKASWSTLSSSSAGKASWGFRSGELKIFFGLKQLVEFWNSRCRLRYEAKEAKEKKKICRELTSAILLRYSQPQLVFYLAIIKLQSYSSIFKMNQNINLTLLIGNRKCATS